MNWKPLIESDQLITIFENSFSKPQLIFKHSTRCSISSMVKNRLDHANFPENFDLYYLDLIAFRDLSNKLSEKFKVQHESPQVLLIKQGKTIYAESHMAIYADRIITEANN